MIKNYYLPLIIIISCFNMLFSQSIFTNDITQVNPQTDNPFTNGQIVDPNITVSGIGRGSGITGSNANNRYNARGWDTPSIDLDAYFEFTLTPNANFEIDFISFEYTGQTSATGPSAIEIRSSVDGFMANIGTPTVTGAIIDLSSTSFQNIISAITFRVYAWNASSNPGTFSINDFVFNGIVSSTNCTSTTIWDGITWDNGLPDANKAVVLNENYDTATDGGSFIGCSLTVNPNYELIVNNGEFIEIETDVVVENNAEIIIETQGSFIQNGNAAAAGSFVLNGTASSQVNKFTSPLNNWYDYTYWSSPVANADVDVALSFANADRRFLYNANNYLDLDNDDIDDNGDDWTLATGSGPMEIGRGYAATHTQIGFIAGASYQYNFIGALNTGDYSFPLAYNASNTNHWNLVGNPYPSAIDTDLLFAGNTSINNVVYLWSQYRAPLNTNPGNEVLNFNQNDYLIINGTMATGNGSDLNGDNVIDGLDVPERKIPSGQSFFVSSLSSNPILFNNSMRVSGDNENNEFYRNSSSSTTPNTDNKLWINLSSDNGVYGQTGIGYIDGATNGFDGMSYDAKRNESYTNAASIYSLIDGITDTKFVIQGKSIDALSEQETIKLGFSTNVTSPTIYSIKALKFEGSFLDNNPIYIKDNLLNTVQNLKNADYNFTSETGEFNGRFEIVFTPSALSIDDNLVDANDLTITELPNGKVQFNVGKQLMIFNVEVLDILGRQIYNLQGSNSNEVYDLSILSNTTYVAKVTLSNGQVISKKAVKLH